jgi:hypothetical protein
MKKLYLLPESKILKGRSSAPVLSFFLLLFGAVFWAQQASAQCSALTTLTAASGTFDDGSGANNYNNNQSCSWLIQPTGSAAGDTITVSFSSFELETCCDEVRLYDGTDETATLLGENTTEDVTGTSGAMYVTFTTDNSGFEASYSYSPYVPTPCSGATTLTGTTGSFDDGSEFNNYNNNQSCSWLIQPTGSAAGDTITVSFSSFALETCCDFVRLYDGTDETATLLGENTTEDVTGTSGAMYVTFTTDNSILTLLIWIQMGTASKTAPSTETILTRWIPATLRKALTTRVTMRKMKSGLRVTVMMMV